TPRPQAWASTVEVLAAYSHTLQPADLQGCIDRRALCDVPYARPAPRRPWSLRDRLDQHSRATLVAAYRTGATAASLATTHGISLRSVKRLLAAEGVHRKQPPTQRVRGTNEASPRRPRGTSSNVSVVRAHGTGADTADVNRGASHTLDE
ncbi:MAG: hypothetical protein ACRCYU_24465, partial [Nocardioides sp.]